MIVEMIIKDSYNGFFEFVISTGRVQTKSTTKPAFHSLRIHYGTPTTLSFGLVSLKEQHPRISADTVAFVVEKFHYWME
jgi:hypothetical protein